MARITCNSQQLFFRTNTHFYTTITATRGHEFVVGTDAQTRTTRKHGVRLAQIGEGLAGLYWVHDGVVEQCRNNLRVEIV